MEYFKRLVNGVLLGLGFMLVVIPGTEIHSSWESHNRNESYLVYDESKVNDFKLENTRFNKYGPYLGISGEIQGNDFTNVVGFRFKALVFDGEQLIEDCYMEDHKSDKNNKWYFEGTCSNILYEAFEVNFRHEVVLRAVSIKDPV
ncbi:hypothetical protein KO525_08870 [Psychrosphaera sp. B3R10]|uniref:hypothetical protein n=1 Tax=unclassified Psychrosphaera TaxID=2641570 RepID=UPI001C08A52F|nr:MULTISPECIES: hypothetical protein [unclassified Psychrosphaera]MBU2881502.1 hypothetical protein [Psychrosphaera sp. I2R16]MBU2989486.1 hypothetical protein [Psychrosphaera sp. B3R10]